MTSNLEFEIIKTFNSLINDLANIISVKWLQNNNAGFSLIQNISNNFIDLYANDDESKKVNIRNKNNSISNDFKVLNESILTNFDSLITQMDRIREKIQNTIKLYPHLIEYDLICDLNGLKNDLTILLKNYKNELNLKKQIIEQHLFKNRDNRDELIALSSFWSHEPFIECVLNAKIKTINDFINKTRRT
jgi:hypothetical protein